MKRSLRILSLFVAVFAMTACTFSGGGSSDPEEPDVPSEVKSISLDKNELSFNLNPATPSTTAVLTATIDVTGTLSKDVKWSVKNSAICSLSPEGTTCAITALEVGETVITCSSAADYRKSATCSVSVINDKATVTGVVVNPSTATVNLFDSPTTQFSATVQGTNNPSQDVTWSLANSSDSTYGEISQTGLFTAKSVKGSPIFVKATSVLDPNFSAQSSVTIIDTRPTVSSVTVSPSTASVNVYTSATVQLSATVNGSYSPSQEVTWALVTSSDSTYGEVDQNGLFTAKKAKSTAVRVKATSVYDSKYYGTASITISDSTPTVTSVSVTPSTGTINLYDSNTLQLSAKVNGNYSPSQEVTWSLNDSSDSQYATVDANTGLVTGLKVKSTTVKIRATSTYNTSKYGTASISIVNNEPKVTSVTMSQTTADLRLDKTLTLTATVNGSNLSTEHKTVSWSSSATSIATVNGGVVTPVNTGSATITATSDYDTTKKATCVVTVKEVSANDDYTMMFYICGANLESGGGGQATADINEILNATAIPDNVNLVFCTGGADDWESGSPVTTAKLSYWHVEYKSSQNKLVKDSTTPSDKSMGLSSTLETFMKYTIDNYAADKYGIVFWNHGGSMSGCCFDERNSDDGLHASEIATASKNALTYGDLSKFEWIGYDACTMATADIASVNADYYHYMVCSQELENGTGWYYTNWIKSLFANPTQSTDTLLKKICTDFISTQSSEQTLSYLKLDNMATLISEFNSYASTLSSWSTITSAASSARNFAYGSSYYSYYCYGSVDFIGWLTKMGVTSGSLYNAVQNIIGYSGYTSDYKTNKPCGVNVFVAYNNPGSFQISKSDYTTADTKFTNWRTLNINNWPSYY